MQVQEMMATHPDAPREHDELLTRCIEACHACAQACIACADACLSEDEVAKLGDCIRLNLDCADLCATVGRVVTRRTGANDGLLPEIISLCALACRLCADECGRHARMHEHCKVCATECRRCAEACNEATRALRGRI